LLLDWLASTIGFTIHHTRRFTNSRGHRRLSVPTVFRLSAMHRKFGTGAWLSGVCRRQPPLAERVWMKRHFVLKSLDIKPRLLRNEDLQYCPSSPCAPSSQRDLAIYLSRTSTIFSSLSPFPSTTHASRTGARHSPAHHMHSSSQRMSFSVS